MAVVGEQAAQAKLIAGVGYRAVALLGSTLRWRTEGLEHFDAIIRGGRQPIMAFWHGRILPATYYFRRRGIVVITSENFDGEWIAGIIERFGYGTARGSTSRGGRRALLQLTRDLAAGQARRIHHRRPARAGTSGSAGRGLAGEGHRAPGAAVPPRGRPSLDAEELGPDTDSEALFDRVDCHGGAVRRARRRGRGRDRIGAGPARGALEIARGSGARVVDVGPVLDRAPATTPPEGRAYTI